jgi:hypothetical protein
MVIFLRFTVAASRLEKKEAVGLVERVAAWVQVWRLG